MFLLASCYRNRDKLWHDGGPSGSYANNLSLIENLVCFCNRWRLQRETKRELRCSRRPFAENGRQEAAGILVSSLKFCNHWKASFVLKILCPCVHLKAKTFQRKHRPAKGQQNQKKITKEKRREHQRKETKIKIKKTKLSYYFLYKVSFLCIPQGDINTQPQNRRDLEETVLQVTFEPFLNNTLFNFAMILLVCECECECVFIYRTYHIVSQGGLQFYLLNATFVKCLTIPSSLW